MAKQITQLTLFVSGTSEIEAEKAALKRAVEQLNSMLDKTHNITLSLIGWPDAFRPGVNTDTQMEINRQLAGYDIYLGILGCRFGTPTPRAGSGTVEEFENAVFQFQKDTGSIRLLFYFKKSPIDPFSTDLRQLEKVKSFRDTLGTRGVVYRDFEDTAEFVRIVTDNLYHLIMDEWTRDGWIGVELIDKESTAEGEDNTGGVTISSTSETANPRENDAGETYSSGVAESYTEASDPSLNGDSDEDDEELGLLEFAEEFQTAIKSLTDSFGRISEHTATVAERFRANTEEVKRLSENNKKIQHVGGSRARQEYLSNAKTIVNQAAEDLESYISNMNAELLELRTSNRAMFSNLHQMITSRAELSISPEKLSEDRHALNTLLEVMRINRDKTIAFQNSVAAIPALTGRFKRARKSARATLGELIAEISFMIDEGGKILLELNLDEVEEV